MNDFLCFYSAGTFTGTSDFYNIELMQQRQLARTGMQGDNLVFVRLPYLTLFFAPLSHLPYATAYWIWQTLSAAALLLMIRLWPVPNGRTLALFACISFPLMLVFVTGQDVNFLLLAITLAALLIKDQRHELAGGILAFGAAKFHFFVLLPLLLWRQRSRPLVMGLLLGGGLLFALCFLAGSLDWMKAYLHALADPRPHAGASHMPNLHGLVTAWHLPAAVEWTLAGAVVLLAAFAVRRANEFLWQISAVLCGGVLVSYHAYIYDCALLLPVALIVFTGTQYRAVRLASFALLTPLPYLATMAGLPAVPILLVAVLTGMALQRKAVTIVWPSPASLWPSAWRSFWFATKKQKNVFSS